MKNTFSRLLKGSAIYGIGTVLQRFLALLLLPFFTSVVSPADYGVVALVSLISVALYGLFSLGTGNSLGVLYFREKDFTKRCEIIWSNFFLLLLNCTVFYCVIFFLSGKISLLVFGTEQYSNLIKISVLGAVLNTVIDPLLAYLRMEEQAIKYVKITLITTASTVAISIWLVLFEQLGALGIIASAMLANALTFFICIFLIGSSLTLKVNLALFFPLVRIGFPSIFGLFAFLVIDYADRKMIESFIDLDALGVYSIGYSFGMIMSVLVGAFATAWPPFFMSYIDKENEAKEIFGRVLRYYILGFGALTILFFAFSKLIVIFMTAEPFHEAFKVIGLVAAAYALKGCYLIIVPGIYFAEKLYKLSITEWFAACTNIVLNLVLIPIYGMTGAALATFLSFLVLPTFSFFFSKPYLKVYYDWNRIFFIVLVLLVSIFLFYLTEVILGGQLFMVIIINSIIVIGFSTISYRFLLTFEEQQYVNSKLLAFKKQKV